MKRRRPLVIAVLGAAAACGLSHSVTVGVPSSPDATFSCSERALQDHHFTITRSQRETGFISGERRVAVVGDASGLPDYFTELAISVYTKDGETQLNVNATRSKQESGGPRSSGGVFVSDGDKAVADSVLHACDKR